jgi:hypothetical protein
MPTILEIEGVWRTPQQSWSTSEWQEHWHSCEWPMPGKKCKPSPIIAINAKWIAKNQTKPDLAILKYSLL